MSKRIKRTIAQVALVTETTQPQELAALLEKMSNYLKERG